MIKEFLNKNELPDVLYHATFGHNLKSIKKLGLTPGKTKNWEDSKDNVVYLATDYDEAASYAECAELIDENMEDDIYVIFIKTSKLNIENLFRDENVLDGDSTFEYRGIIQPDCFVKIKKYS